MYTNNSIETQPTNALIEIFSEQSLCKNICENRSFDKSGHKLRHFLIIQSLQKYEF